MFSWISTIIHRIKVKIRYRRRLRRLKKKPPFIYD